MIRNYTKSLLLSIGFLAVMVIAWVVLSGQISSLDSELNDRLTTIANQNTFASSERQIAAELAASAAIREQTARYVLGNEIETIALLSELDSVAAKLGLVFSTSRLEPVVSEEEESRFGKLRMDFVFSGREESVRAMIDLLEELPYHSEVWALSLSRSQATADSTEAAIELIVSTRTYD